MSLGLLLLSFFAGILTVFAPCVFTLLPAIIGGGIENPNDKGRPFRIALSLGISVFIFTLLLKVSTVLINVPQLFWDLFAGIVIISFGIVTIFPTIWSWLSFKTGVNAKANQRLNTASQSSGLQGDILVGLALGPVFTSCSPTYFLIIGVTFAESISSGMIYLLLYSIGLSLMLIILGIGGQKIIKNLKWAVNPHSKFKIVLGVVFILIGIAFIFGLNKDFQTFVVQNLGFLNVTKIESLLSERLL